MQGVYTLLLAGRVKLAEANLDVVRIGQIALLRRQPARTHGIVPVDAQQREFARCLGDPLQRVHD